MEAGSDCEGEIVFTGHLPSSSLRVEILKQIQLPMIVQSYVISKVYKLCSPQVTTSVTRSCHPEQSCSFTTSPEYPESAAEVKQPSAVLRMDLKVHHWANGPPRQRVKYLYKAKHLLGALRLLSIHNFTGKRLCKDTIKLLLVFIFTHVPMK